MADNTQLNTGLGGDIIAADDIGAVKFQRVKLIHGIDGVNDGDIAKSNPLPVQVINTSRTEVFYHAVGVAGNTTSAAPTATLDGALIPMRILKLSYVAGAQAPVLSDFVGTAGGTSIQIAPNKRFKLTHFSVAVRGGLTVTTSSISTVFSLRIETNAPATSSSPLMFRLRSVTNAFSGNIDRVSLRLPADGIDIPAGPASNVCLGVSALSTFTTAGSAPTYDVTLLGYEY